MLEEYPGTYRDHKGEEAVTIRNDGKTLSMTVRGVEFVGNAFDIFEPTCDFQDERLKSFPLNRYQTNAAELCGCEISWVMALPAVVGDVVEKGMLHAHLELGIPNERGLLKSETLRLILDIGGDSYASSGTSGLFEIELVSLQAALPEGMYLKTCFSCAFSDYSVYGNGLFGNMLCFRNQKAAYLAVRDKDEYMDIMDNFAELVQETYLCPEFERRKPGTGYRG